jgi:hypothetical protein
MVGRTSDRKTARVAIATVRRCVARKISLSGEKALHCLTDSGGMDLVQVDSKSALCVDRGHPVPE